MKIDHNIISRLARLARLDIGTERERIFRDQLPRIVEYVGQLQDVVIENVPEVEKTTATLRADATVPSDARDAILNQAPDRLDDFWKVKSVF